MNRLDKPIFLAVSKPLLTEFAVGKEPSIASNKETFLWSGPVVFWRVRQSQSEVRRFAPRIFDIRSGRKCCVAADGSVVPHGPSRRSRNGCAPPSPAATAG